MYKTNLLLSFVFNSSLDHNSQKIIGIWKSDVITFTIWIYFIFFRFLFIFLLGIWLSHFALPRNFLKPMKLPVKYFLLVIYDIDCSNEIFWLEIPDYNTDIIISVDKNQYNKIIKKNKKTLCWWIRH
jgi:hypothetical protein